MREFQSASIDLLLDDPFYATLLLSMKHVLTGHKEPTLATNSLKLWVNPGFFKGLSRQLRKSALKHECLHALLMHCSVKRLPPAVYTNREAMAMAVDYVVNNLLVQDGNEISPSWYFEHKYRGWTVEQIYRDIMANDPPPDSPQEGGEGGEGGDDPRDGQGQGAGQPSGKPQQGEGPDALGDDTKQLDPADAAVAEAKIQQAASTGLVLAKKAGKMPGKGIRDLVGELLNPELDYKETLADWMNMPSRDDFSFARLNRRFVSRGMRLPAMYSPTGAMRHLVVLFDISLSISPDEVRRYTSEIYGAAQDVTPTKISLVFCDTRVVRTDTFDELDEAAINGLEVPQGGGTDMTVGLRHIADEFDDVEGVIIVTDGYTPFGNEPDFPTLWLVTSSIKAPYGQSVQIPVGDK